jgi:hypothetical protein
MTVDTRRAGPETRDGRTADGRRPPEAPRVPEPERPAALSLWIDDYDDIFSDFDPRPFGQRALSEDFLAEARRAVRDRRESIPALRFLVPAVARNLADEATIRKHLREHFQKHADRLGRARRRKAGAGLAIAAAGFAVMTASALIRGQPETFWRTLLHVLLEPSGWFAVWFGLDQLVYGTRDVARDHDFYRKIARADVVFVSYPEEAHAS